MSSRTGQWARALDAAASSLKAWDAAERAHHTRFRAETDARREAFDKAMAALGAAR